MSNIGIQMKDNNNNNVYPNPFPIGAIYMSIDSRNPSVIFGGTWEQIKDKFIMCAGDSYKAGSTGGSSSHYHSTGNCTLSVDQIPSHRHQGIYNADGTVERWGGWGETSTHTGTLYEHGENQWEHLYTGYTGGTKAHNHGNTGSSSNIPPYIAIYVWKRVA